MIIECFVVVDGGGLIVSVEVFVGFGVMLLIVGCDGFDYDLSVVVVFCRWCDGW